MATVNLFGTKEQIDFVLTPYEGLQAKRFLSLIAGRRWAKSYCARNRAAVRISRPNTVYWYVTPYASQYESEFDAWVYHPSPGIQKLIKRAKLQPYPQIWFKNGSILAFRCFNANPQSLRSKGVHEIWIDEIQDIDGDPFWPVVRPLVSASKGNIVISGQHRGVQSWYYKDLWIKGQEFLPDPKTGLPTKELNPLYDPLYKSWQYSSSSGLCYRGEAGQKEYELARSQIPRIVFEQEYECIPTANSNCLYLEEHISQCIRGAALQGPASGRTYILGYDVGQQRDFGAIVVLEIETNTVVYSEKMPLRQSHDVSALKVREIATRFRCPVVIDATGGGGGSANPTGVLHYYKSVIPDLKPIYWQGGVRKDLIDGVELDLQQARISIPAVHTQLINELRAMEFQYKGSGLYDFRAKKGMHDDLHAALAMCIYWRHRNMSRGAGLLPANKGF